MKRLLTALILTPFFFYIATFAPAPLFLAVVALLGGFCFYEYLGIVGATYPGFEQLQRSPLGYIAGLVLLLLPPGQVGIFVLLFALAAFALSLRYRDLAAALPLTTAQVFGLVYVFGAWRTSILIREISPWWLLFATAINWVGDTFAYYTGRAFGRHKLAPEVSPGKSWEGTVGSLVAALVLGGAYLHWMFPHVALPQALALCAAANVVGQLGDLCESAMKRGAGVKDSGTLLPGHGGWLDRVDSSLFSMPVVYWLLQQPWFGL